MSSAEAVLHAYSRGINFFFVSADLHWPKYEGTREGLRALVATAPRSSFVVCAASYVAHPRFNEGPFQELLEAIPGLDYLDLLCLGAGGMGDYTPRLKVLQQQRDESAFGCRAIGASFHDRRLATSSLTTAAIDVGFVRFNPTHLGARAEVFQPLAGLLRPPPVFAFKTAAGHLAPHQLAHAGLPPDNWIPEPTALYRFALAEPGLAGVLVSMRQPKYLDELEQALEQGPLSPEEHSYLEQLYGRVARRQPSR